MPEAGDERVVQAAEGSPAPKTLDAWITLKNAELMLAHLSALPMHWPQSAIYCHNCITALRSTTLVLKKALAHEPGFTDWYAENVEVPLSADPEFRFLLKARNYVLKEGALELQGSHEFGMTGSEQPPGLEIRGVRADGPDVWAANPTDPSSKIPVDWRRVPGFYFVTHLRIADMAGLPPPPDKELKSLLAEKIAVLEACSVRRMSDSIQGAGLTTISPHRRRLPRTRRHSESPLTADASRAGTKRVQHPGNRRPPPGAIGPRNGRDLQLVRPNPEMLGQFGLISRFPSCGRGRRYLRARGLW